MNQETGFILVLRHMHTHIQTHMYSRTHTHSPSNYASLQPLLHFTYLHSWEERMRFSVATLSVRYCGVRSGMRTLVNNSGKLSPRSDRSRLVQDITASNTYKENQTVQ